MGSKGKPELRDDLQLWYYPPQPALSYNQAPAPDRFFCHTLLLWMPYKLWRVKILCPNPACGQHQLTGGGLHKRARQVLDIDRMYNMVTETLICTKCRVLHVSWSQTVLQQLDLGHRSEFRVILTRKYACDMRVIRLLRERSLGNSPTRVIKQLRENHSEEWLKRLARYTTQCVDFLNRPRVPITKKLAGTARGMGLWLTSVGNEFGQVLISVLTAQEGAGLNMMDYLGMYNRCPSAVPIFMSRLSACIFEWDAADLSVLRKAKRALLVSQGWPSLADEDVNKHLTREELGLHCQKRTRGENTTILLLERLFTELLSRKGNDSLGVPLLDQKRMEHIWSVQKKHVKCIQDPPGVVLYTETGSLTKGGVLLKTYRCARGSTSLKSFHLHRNCFIPVLLQGWALHSLHQSLTPHMASHSLLHHLDHLGLLSHLSHLKHLFHLSPQSQRILVIKMMKRCQNVPGYQHVDRLAEYLVDLRGHTALSMTNQEANILPNILLSTAAGFQGVPMLQVVQDTSSQPAAPAASLQTMPKRPYKRIVEANTHKKCRQFKTSATGHSQ
ncbi:hypothetical protein QQF64_035724 [Cirrhinus molitorella]|uniref:DUF6729 domain-containing protein n=1 Tax=Cirrhinus molitorella TaxID=172907 RepID=A0ABR3NGK8_9TELE